MNFFVVGGRLYGEGSGFRESVVLVWAAKPQSARFARRLDDFAPQNHHFCLGFAQTKGGFAAPLIRSSSLERTAISAELVKRLNCCGFLFIVAVYMYKNKKQTQKPAFCI